MQKLTFSELKDVYPGLRKKLLDAVKGQPLKISCPECGASFGSNSLRYWLSYDHKTCGKCRQKVKLDFSGIKKVINDIEKM